MLDEASIRAELMMRIEDPNIDGFNVGVNSAIAHSCCVRSRRGKCCCDTEFYAASRQELRSFKLLSVPLGTLSMLSAYRVPL